MRQRHAALDVVDHNGLGVQAVAVAGGAVAHMAHGHVARAQAVQHILGEHIVHQADVLIRIEQAVVVHHNAAALLAAVLQGEQAVVHGFGDVLRIGGEHPEHAAFLS